MGRPESAMLSEEHARKSRSGLAQLRAAYTPEKAWQEMSGELPAYLLYRPISFLVSWPLLTLGVPASAVTALCLLIGLGLPILAALGASQAFLPVALGALCFHVLDCVDGNLARARGTSSRLGAWFDGFADQVFWTGLYLALGLMVRASVHPLAPHALTLALGCALLVSLTGRLRDLAHKLSGVRVELPEQRPERLSLVDWIVILFGSLENLYALAILLAGFTGHLPELLLGIAAYVSVVFAVSTALCLAQLTRTHTR